MIVYGCVEVGVIDFFFFFLRLNRYGLWHFAWQEEQKAKRTHSRMRNWVCKVWDGRESFLGCEGIG